MQRSAAALVLAGLLGGCAPLQHYAADSLGNALAASGSGFAADDDPELIRAAAPFSLKLIESLLAERPQHAGLLTAAASGFAQYAYAFVAQDADEIEGRDIAAAAAQRARARSLYVRARDYGLRALEVRHPGFQQNPRASLSQLGKHDVRALYWTALAWAASISLAKESMQTVADLPLVDALVARTGELDADFDGLDSFLISYQMARPGVRNAEAAARRHFERALRLSGGQKAAPYVALAETVCVAAQNRREFIAALESALAIDPAARAEWRLENRILQRRARWLLTQADQLFLEPEEPK